MKAVWYLYFLLRVLMSGAVAAGGACGAQVCGCYLLTTPIGYFSWLGSGWAQFFMFSYFLFLFAISLFLAYAAIRSVIDLWYSKFDF